MQEHYVLTIKAEDRPGLLHLVSGMIEKRLVKIISLSYAPTDIHQIVLITAEIITEESIAAQLALKLENIVEVFGVEVAQLGQVLRMRAAFFKLSKTLLESPAAIALSKYDATIVRFYPGALLLAKHGTEEAIQNLYNALDGPHLLGFSQTGLIADSRLMSEDQSSVINRLAA